MTAGSTGRDPNVKVNVLRRFHRGPKACICDCNAILGFITLRVTSGTRIS